MPLPQLSATGNLTRDPELRFLADGTAVASLTVACSKSKKGDDGAWQTLATVYLDCNLWRADAETAAEQLRKGDKVVVTGNLIVREWEGKDGKKGKSVEVDFPTVAKVVKAPREFTPHPARPATDPARDAWAEQPAEAPF